MIVVADGTELLLVTQPDHARFAAQLLSLWHRPEMRRHPRRELLLAAVREHDNGWREEDAAPRIDPASGHPFDFRALPDEHRRELWRRGVERFADDEPYISLLLAQHCLELHRDRRGRPGWADYLDELEERRLALLEAAGLGDAQLTADYPWLELADRLSLAACRGAPGSLRRGRLIARMGGGELRIEPFPLAGATSFEIPCRRIVARRYRGEADLAGTLGAARWGHLTVRCRPV